MDTFVRREDAERFIEEVRDDDAELASYLRIEERELEASGRDCGGRSRELEPWGKRYEVGRWRVEAPDLRGAVRQEERRSHHERAIAPQTAAALVLAVCGALLVSAGIAYATIPDASGQYHACVLSGVGQVRIIDHDAGAKLQGEPAARPLESTKYEGGGCMSKEELATRRISRKRLLKRAGFGGAVLLATPVMASTASAQRLPRFTCGRGGCGVDCEVGGDPCASQRTCTNPDERLCTCLCRTAGPNNPAGRCFCHEPSPCSALPPCTRQADCPDDWACAASCCSADASEKFCHPPCGTPAFARALSGRTSVGTI